MWSDNLRRLREKTGLEQQAFAKKLGISKTTYNGYETGRSEPRLSFWISVAKEFDTSIDFLLGKTEDTRAYYSTQERAEQCDSVLLLKFSETLNEKGKQKLLDYAADLNKIQDYKA